MKFGVVFPGGTAKQQLELAVMAEECGWDGVFIWEALYGIDPWTTLAAIAQKTSHVKLGSMLTPLAWRRPWKVASQVVTLDQLSDGRAIIAVGLGAKLGDFGEPQDRRTRAELLDEGIDIMRGLWDNKLVFDGQHYKIDVTERDDLGAVAMPVQEHIPIWCVGGWPRAKSMQRIVRCDGLLPQLMEGEMYAKPSADQVREMKQWLIDRGAREDIDIILDGETTPDSSEDRDQLAAWAEAGVTWWNETRWEMPHYVPERLEQVRQRLRAGPPKI